MDKKELNRFPQNKSKDKRILVVGVNWLGDSIMTTPAFKALKHVYPESYIAVMTVSRVKEVFEDNPCVDEVIIFDEKTSHKSIKEKIKFIKFLKEKKFQKAFLIHRSFTRALICRLAAIPSRAGYQRLKNYFILTDKVGLPKEGLHRQDYYLNLFKKSGIAVENSLPEFFIPPGVLDRVSRALEFLKKDHSCLVGVNPSANWELKRWPPEYFSVLCDRLVKGMGAGVVFVGGESDEKITREVIGRMREPAYSLCGKTTLKELAAVIKNISLFISNDSGPAHLSAALGVSTLALFGPTSPKITSPRGRRVRVIKNDCGCKVPCYDLNCKNNICMQKITVEEVYLEAKNMLDNLV
ncbi:MAG: lipopolysaccharide heptosyltransferase II [Candidatus Omnitrophica bacterium]|nr:lipopolysaccharide heptosyltransferase II [Candidatus Omnitrophota bacterium]MDD5429113.1 lipopolysaccharide heptosyltransferase II [Candidatus Omnitrophota bacterium]